VKDFKLILQNKKPPVLTRADFGCLSGVPTLNVTAGCGLGCLYCYARAYPQAPPPDTVVLYANLPRLIVRKLDNPRARTRPAEVVFNTASDCFQPHPDVLDVTMACMAALLERGVRISFLTKGMVPDRFIRLFARQPDLVSARIGLVCLDENYTRTFEPGAAAPGERLDNLVRLQAAGVQVGVRLDPIIPFVTDGERHITELCRVLADLGLKEITASYLHLRPGLIPLLDRDLPPLFKQLIFSSFPERGFHKIGGRTRARMVPAPLRAKGYERLRRIAGQAGLAVKVCRCKNPDLPGDLCLPSFPSPTSSKTNKTLPLFPC